MSLTIKDYRESISEETKIDMMNNLPDLKAFSFNIASDLDLTTVSDQVLGLEHLYIDNFYYKVVDGFVRLPKLCP